MESTAEVNFAQKLASNEKTLRDRAIKKLRKYIAAKSTVGFSEDDYLKIWKGLHYCMWMQDKPIIQEELSVNIARLVHILKNHKQALLFVKVFFKTEAREWGGIDFWRVDKFMMFIRDMLNESFAYLRNKCWNSPVVKAFVTVVNDTLLDSANDDIPDGIRTHLADIYLPELNKVGADQLTSSQIVSFLAPFITFIQRSRNLHIVNRVISGVFYPVISQTIGRFKKQKEKENKTSKKEKTLENSETNEGESDDDSDLDDDDDDESGDDEMIGKVQLHLKYDCREIADKLFEAGSNSNCSPRNRKIIYRLVKRLRNAADGVLPRIPKDVGDTKVGLKEINRAVKALQSTEMKYLKKNEKAKIRNRKNKGVKNDENKPADNQPDSEDAVLLPNGKRKKKSTVETVHKKMKKAENKEHLESDAKNKKSVKSPNNQKKKKMKMISHDKGDKSVDDEGAEIVLGKKNEREDDKSMKLDADHSKPVLKTDADSTLAQSDTSSKMTKKSQKKTKQQLALVAETCECTSQSEVKSDEDGTFGSTQKSSKHKNKKTMSALKNTDASEDGVRLEMQPLPAADAGVKLTPVVKNKKTISALKNTDASEDGVRLEMQPLPAADAGVKLTPVVKNKRKAHNGTLNDTTGSASKDLKTKAVVTCSGGDGKDTVLSSKKKKKKADVLVDKHSEVVESGSLTNFTTVSSNTVSEGKMKINKKENKLSDKNSENVVADNQSGLSNVSSNMASEKKKKNNKKESLPDSTVNTDGKSKKRGSLSTSAVDNKNNYDLPDSTVATEKAQTESSAKCTKIKQKHSSEGKATAPSLARNLMDEFRKPLEEGEVEIFVPSKKWAGKLQSSWIESVSEGVTSLPVSPKFENEEKTTSSASPKFENEEKRTSSASPKFENKGSATVSPKSVKEGKSKSSVSPKTKEAKMSALVKPFAKFEKISQTPIAFARKRATPRTEPRKRKLQAAGEAPSMCFSAGKKRVSFDPTRNQSRDIKDSLKSVSDAAFLPEKTPTQGILKSPVVTSSAKKSKKPSKKSVIKNTITNSKTSFTPISQNRVLTRARAADFF